MKCHTSEEMLVHTISHTRTDTDTLTHLLYHQLLGYILAYVGDRMEMGNNGYTTLLNFLFFFHSLIFK